MYAPNEVLLLGFITNHQDNMPMKSIPPYTPLLCVKLGFTRYTFFSYF